MPNRSKEKGSRYEREVAQKLTEAGVPSKRVIGSGAHGCVDARLTGDVQIGTRPNGDWTLTGEVKYRRHGSEFKVLNGWLGDNDVLFLRQANKEYRVFMPYETFIELLKVYYEGEVNE